MNDVNKNLLGLWSVFDNREKALTIWVLIILAIVLYYKGSREPLLSALKILLSKKLAIPLILMGAYISLIVFCAYKLSLWDMSLLKDTIIWGIGVGFIMFWNYNKATDEKHYVKDTLLKNLKFTAILEFILNIYVFSFVAEFILLPVLTLIVLTAEYSKVKQEFAPARKLLNIILAIVGIYFVSHAIIAVIFDFKNFATIHNLKYFLIIPLLTLAYIPCIYLLALYSVYEDLFVRMNFLIKADDNVKKEIKWKIIKAFSVDLNRLNNFSRNSSTILMSVTKRKDVAKFNKQLKNKKLWM